MSEPMYEWARDLWSMPRSITGVGVRQTIGYLQELIHGLEMHNIESGTKVFDWIIPQEYFVEEAYVELEDGRRVIDYNDNNLHLVGYSSAVDTLVSNDVLDKHLYSLPDIPDAIPYITSYYKDRWGFCLSHNQRMKLPDATYHAVIKSKKFDGVMNYADLVIKGDTEEEVVFSTYICHPMMANDNLSGIVVTTALARWIMGLKNRRYTYRFIFVPETIGSIAYLSSRLAHMKKHVIAGYVVTCCGGNGHYEVTLLESRRGDTLADRAAACALQYSYSFRSFTERGADERQYCYPGIDLPFASIMRPKYGEYPEYHTSKDNLSFISQEALNHSFDEYKSIIELIEANRKYTCNTKCEPFLTNHDISYPETSPNDVPDVLNVLSYCDGDMDLIDISTELTIYPKRIIEITDELRKKGLIS